ncbi:UNVERIFIED_CONTAM: Serine/threonine-protein phosphatase 7 long form [Sesamum indicum]
MPYYTHGVRMVAFGIIFNKIICPCRPLQLNQHLITTLVEKWRSKTHTFYFRVGKATITLQDIQIIWALPIDGEPVTGVDLDRTTQQWQEYCLTYLGFSPDANALKGSRLQTSAITSHLVEVDITYNTPHDSVVQYARAVTLPLLGGLMCPDSSGNYVSLLYLSKLEDTETRGTIVRGMLCWHFYIANYAMPAQKAKRQLLARCNCYRFGHGHGLLHFALDLVSSDYLWAKSKWTTHWLPTAPYGATWNCQHTFTRTVWGTVRVIREILDEMQFIWRLHDMDSDVIMTYADKLSP